MRRLQLYSLAITLSFFATTASAQTAAKSVYFELGGPGVASFNYDMRLMKKENGLGFRVGAGGFKIDGTSALFIPVGLNYLLGKDERNYFEIGSGITFVSINDDYDDPYYPDQDKGEFESTFGHLFFGYRLQPKNGGFLFRAGLNPIFGKGYFIPYYAGVSFGYKF